MALTFKAARVNAGLSRLEAAQKLEVTPETMRNWESGKTCPTVVMAKRMADLYGITICDFLIP